MGVPTIDLGIRTDILSNCTKKDGILMAIRSMAPKIIALDEIGKKRGYRSHRISRCKRSKGYSYSSRQGCGRCYKKVWTRYGKYV